MHHWSGIKQEEKTLLLAMMSQQSSWKRFTIS
jgi:hypothetical protein